MKPSSFFMGAVDFFAAFLPGVVVVAVMLVLVGMPADLFAPLGDSQSAAALALFASAYLVGSVLNAVASRVLDDVFERVYGTKQPGQTPRGGENPWPLIAHVNAALDAQKIPRDVRDERNPYPIVRAYLHLALPRSASEVERFEAEQKLFRTTTIGAVLVGLAFAGRWLVHREDADVGVLFAELALAAIVAVIAFERYVEMRRKTIRRAYHYFVMRGVAAAVEGAQPARASDAEDDE